MAHYNLDTINDDFVYRLALDHIRLEKLEKLNQELIQCKVEENSKIYPHPPVSYRITYKIRSIISIDEEKLPNFGEAHELQIRLPVNYPEQPAECKMLSDTWHPNIKSGGPFKGAICTNHTGFGSLYHLDELVIRIGEFLQYKRYLAEDRPPWPEDREVAHWVKNEAEPKDIVNKEKSIYTDYKDWRIDFGDLDDMENLDGTIVISEKK